MSIRFAIIGTNFITDWVLEGARLDSRFVLQAIYSRSEETGRAYAQKYGVERVYTSLEELAAAPDIDAVYIASPNVCHCEQAIQMMRAGKHVLCEKPLCSNQREAQQMFDEAERHGVVLMEAMKSTLTPNFKAVMANLHRVGTIRRYFAAYCQYSSRYDALKQGVVMNAFKPELSNGALVDLGVYTIYPMVVLFGRPRRITATGMLLSTGVDGQGTVICEYDGMEAVMMFSKIADSHLPAEIQGEEGTIRFHRVSRIHEVQFQPRKGEIEELTQPHCGEEYYYEVQEFIDLIERGDRESMINSREHSLITMEILDEVRRQIGVVYPADQK